MINIERLIPAANATAMVAAIVHVVSLGLVSGSLGLEYIYIAFLTYLITLVLAIPAGAVLLAVVGVFRLGLILSLLLFLVSAQFVIIVLTMYLFEFKLADVPLEYAFVTIPPSLTAWYFSVYHNWKKDHGVDDTTFSSYKTRKNRGVVNK